MIKSHPVLTFPRYSKTIASLLASTFAMLGSTSFAQGIPHFPETDLNIGLYVIKAEVAATPAQREQGLMFRTEMAPNEGMVFIFEQPASVCMWMKNTLLPLSVAFIDGSGRIVNIEDMKPQTLDSHCSKKDTLVRYALEMNLDWFKKKNIKPGAIISNLPATK